MLDGLEAIEVNSQVVLVDDLRLEAKFYSMKSFENKEFWYCGDILEDANYNSIYGLNTQGVGYPIIRMNEFEGLFTGTPEQHSDKFTKNDFESHRLRKDDILICRTNGNPDLIGKSALVAMDYQYVYESHMFKVKPNRNLVNSSVLVTFLNTKYGRMEIDRLSMQGNQANFSLAKFKEVRIPKFDNEFQLKIEQILYGSHHKLEESKQLYKEAEELLLSELGLLNFVPNNDNIAIQSFSDSFSVSGRLDSEYYQPKYDDIEQRIYSKPHTFINKEFSQITTSFDKTKDGYNYIEIGDVNVSDGVHSYNYVLTEELPANAKIKVANGDLIVSTVRPYRGAVSIINIDDIDLVVSGAFTVLRSKLDSNYSTQVLQVLLRTQIYKNFMLKYNVGSSYPVIKDENVMNLPIPLLSYKIQKQIEDKIKQSFVLKEQSKQLLELAKRAVEIAIEVSEDSAMELINNAKI